MSDFARYLPRKLNELRPATAYAPSNIALSKYWGKRDKALNLPLNSSLSISLGNWGTTTSVSASDNGQDEVIFNGTQLSLDNGFAAKVIAFADRFRRGQPLPLKIQTNNSIPTAAGLASSASGFAALTVALAKGFALDLPESTLSMMARLGSGSATRSLWHGFVRWDRGLSQDGDDSYARPLDVHWPEFRIAIIPVDTGPKSFSSRDGMNHTVETSPLFPAWPEQAEADCKVIESAIRARDFDTLGQCAEANALAMHATMMAARPALCYLKPESWKVLDTLWAARTEGLSAYATADAGANIKLLFLQKSEQDVSALFPNAKLITPIK